MSDWLLPRQGTSKIRVVSSWFCMVLLSSVDQMTSLALDPSSDILTKEIAPAVARSGVAAVISYPESSPEGVYIVSAVFDRDGELSCDFWW